MRTFLFGLGAWLCGLAVQAADFDYALKPRALAAGVYVIEGAVADFEPANGCNIINTGFIVTEAGVVVINTGPSKRYGEQQRAAIRRITPLPILRVLNLNLHPDYFFGNQAYADLGAYALPGTQRGQKAEGAAYENNMYRLCGDWMRDTVATPATRAVEAGHLQLGGRKLTLLHLSGHTPDDLVLLDETSGVLFAGGLAFHARVPTTPHADLPVWLQSLDQLAALPFRIVVPSHGPVAASEAPITQTRSYLRWLDATLRDAATRGLDINEVLATPIPEPYRSFAVLPTEFMRNVTHLYPRYEQKALGDPLSRD
ncbi:MAG: quinoprotein relay system zinc metallohydrolase 1 [Rhodocyclaceae bacterium]|nr:quinoprotein relay system zinc metallohydrolase 1 [Rhodocyclaceae bacterium]MBX3666797.1 quinoprotein relay system zinc metallohydrolase 1 [Rhodocyclaceae bacterium]